MQKKTPSLKNEIVCKSESRFASFLMIYCGALLPRYWTGYNVVSFHFHNQQITLLSDYRTSGCTLFLYLKTADCIGRKKNSAELNFSPQKTCSGKIKNQNKVVQALSPGLVNTVGAMNIQRAVSTQKHPKQLSARG